MFDTDGSGAITADEIKQMFMSGDQKVDDKIWEDVVKEVDGDGNGEIDFEEFVNMM